MCNKPVTKRVILYGVTYTRYLEYSMLQRQKKEWWLPGAEREEKQGVICLMGKKFQFCKMKSYQDEWW